MSRSGSPCDPQARCASTRDHVSESVFLGRAARESVHNTDKLAKQAEAVAANITVPPGIEFTKFEHMGKTYALSARVLIEVELLGNRVPDVTIRSGAMVMADRRKKKWKT